MQIHCNLYLNYTCKNSENCMRYVCIIDILEVYRIIRI